MADTVEVWVLSYSVKAEGIEDYPAIEFAIVPVVQDNIEVPSGFSCKFSFIQFKQGLERLLYRRRR